MKIRLNMVKWWQLEWWFFTQMTKTQLRSMGLIKPYPGPTVTEFVPKAQPVWRRVPVEVIEWPKDDRPAPEPVAFIIEMENETGGTDDFYYDSRQAMHEGLIRLVSNALVWAETDGMNRSFTVAQIAPRQICPYCDAGDPTNIEPYHKPEDCPSRPRGSWTGPSNIPFEERQ